MTVLTVYDLKMLGWITCSLNLLSIRCIQFVSLKANYIGKKDKEFIFLVLDRTSGDIEKDGSDAGLLFLTVNGDVEERFSKFCGKF